MGTLTTVDSALAQNLPSSQAPKQRGYRHKIEMLVYANLGPGNGGFPIDLSEGGMAFQGIRPLEKGQTFPINFKMPESNCLIETKAQVIWLNELGKGGGLQFIDLSQKNREIISQWLSSKMPMDAVVADALPAAPVIAEAEAKIFAKPEQESENKVTFVTIEPAKSTALAEPAKFVTEATAPVALLAAAKLAAPAPTSRPRRVISARKPSPMASVTLQAKSAHDMFHEMKGDDSLRRPVTIALILFVAILIASLFVCGVVSVQFHVSKADKNSAVQTIDFGAPSTPKYEIGGPSQLLNSAPASEASPAPSAATSESDSRDTVAESNVPSTPADRLSRGN